MLKVTTYWGYNVKRINLIIMILIFLITGCTNTVPEKTEVTEKPIEDEEIDRTKYLTGEIITDGNFDYPENHNGGAIYFVPDEESSKIIKEKYNFSSESFLLFYDNMSKVENLPQELGIYKVKVKADWDEIGKSFVLNDILLTDEIGTVVYDGKTYETNELDENVKVKDQVCGLIVKWISREKVSDSIEIRFAGEIESEGYYTIAYSDMFDDNYGMIYFDEKYFDDIPFYGERGHNNFYFVKTNELFDELQNFSTFGKGKFKTSNYYLVYNIGMGRPASDYLTEIVSLDEAYKNMFMFDKYKYVAPVGISKDFLIVSSANYDEKLNYVSTDYFYVNKNKPEKIFLFNSDGYRYDLKLAANENEFILSTEGYNYITGEQVEGHSMICKIAESGVVTEKAEGLSINSNNIEDNGLSFNIQGNVAGIEIEENTVKLSLRDVKMKEEDALAFGKTLNKDDLIEILIIDNNRSGPFINIGDMIMVSCRYTIDGQLLYTIGADITSRS